MKLEVDFPVNGLPEDRELVRVAYAVPALGEYYFNGQKWNKVLVTFSSVWITAILKPKEVWLPCTPEDAFAKMLHPGSRVIRTIAGTLVTKVTEITEVGMGFYLEGYPFGDGPRCPYEHFQVLKTKELS